MKALVRPNLIASLKSTGIRRSLCGIVSIGDVVKHRLDELEMEGNILRETLFASH